MGTSAAHTRRAGPRQAQEGGDVMEVFWSLVGVIVGAAAKPLLDYVVALLTFNFTGVRVRELAPRWRTTWGFQDPDKAEEHTDVMQIDQKGPFISGRASDDLHDYVVKGRLYPDGIVHGTWTDRQPDKHWYGSFQLLVEPDGSKMVGKWLGNDVGTVRAGDWVWERV